jgi:hypothetical protein
VGTGSATGGGISNNAEASYECSVDVTSNGILYVSWYDSSGGNWEIYVRRYNGSVWEEVGVGSASGGGISNNSGLSREPSIGIAPNDTPYITWYDNSDVDEEIYIRRWNGTIWEEVGFGSATGGGISNNNGNSYYMQIAFSLNGIPHVTWSDNSAGDYEIYILKWLK